MLQHFKLITLSFRQLKLHELKHYVLQGDDRDDKLKELRSEMQLDELLYLSTCNRVIYFCHTSQHLDKAFLQKFFTQVNADIPANELENISELVNIYEGAESIHHMFQVASSIDSLVVGEREILRQFRDAYSYCHQLGITGDNLRLVEKYTILTAKDVYTNTKIGERPVSVVSLTIEKLLEQKEISPESRIILIGAGDTIRLVLQSLWSKGFRDIQLYNRSIETAQSISKELDIQIKLLSELAEHKEDFDSIICCTGATDLILTQELYQQILGEDGSKKVLLDLAVPNNIDRSIAATHNIALIDIEEIRDLADENLKYRQEEVVDAQHIIDRRSLKFQQAYRQRQIERALMDLPAEIKAVKERAVSQVYKSQIDQLDPVAQALITEMLDYMEKKCVGIPMRIARTALPSTLSQNM